MELAAAHTKLRELKQSICALELASGGRHLPLRRQFNTLHRACRSLPRSLQGGGGTSTLDTLQHSGGHLLRRELSAKYLLLQRMVLCAAPDLTGDKDSNRKIATALRNIIPDYTPLSGLALYDTRAKLKAALSLHSPAARYMVVLTNLCMQLLNGPDMTEEDIRNVKDTAQYVLDLIRGSQPAPLQHAEDAQKDAARISEAYSTLYIVLDEHDEQEQASWGGWIASIFSSPPPAALREDEETFNSWLDEWWIEVSGMINESRDEEGHESDVGKDIRKVNAECQNQCVAECNRCYAGCRQRAVDDLRAADRSEDDRETTQMQQMLQHRRQQSYTSSAADPAPAAPGTAR